MTRPTDDPRPRSWLDVLVPYGTSRVGPQGPSDLLGSWLAATSWWIDTAASGPQALRARAPEALGALLLGIGERFGAREVDVVVRGVHVRGVLESIQPTVGDPRGARLHLHDVTVDGVPLDRLSVRAGLLRLDVRDGPRLVAADVEISGRAPMASVGSWIDERIDGWAVTDDDDGLLVFRNARRPVTARARPVFSAGRVVLELRRVTWRRLSIGLPRWLRPRRSLEAQMPDGMRIVGAFTHDDRVDAVVEIESVSQPIDLAALRTAIARGARIALG